MEYLIWYNTEKPHRGIGKLPPLRYYLDNFVTPQKSNMLWTLTGICHINDYGIIFIKELLFIGGLASGSDRGSTQGGRGCQ